MLCESLASLAPVEFFTDWFNTLVYDEPSKNKYRSNWFTYDPNTLTTEDQQQIIETSDCGLWVSFQVGRLGCALELNVTKNSYLANPRSAQAATSPSLSDGFTMRFCACGDRNASARCWETETSQQGQSIKIISEGIECKIITATASNNV